MLRERKDFSFKVYDIWFELRTSLFAGIGYGLVVSIITIGTCWQAIWIGYVSIFIGGLYI